MGCVVGFEMAFKLKIALLRIFGLIDGMGMV
jgi:hypothetical protein